MVLAFKFKIETQLVTQRAHNQIMGRLNRETLERHKTQALPQHFANNAKTSAGGEYGYKPRKLKYTRWKARKTGQTAPLVFTGQLRSAILGSAKVSSTRNGGRIRATGYRVKFRDSTRPILALNPQLKQEIEVVSTRESERAAQRFAREYVKYAKSGEYAKRKRIR